MSAQGRLFQRFFAVFLACGLVPPKANRVRVRRLIANPTPVISRVARWVSLGLGLSPREELVSHKAMSSQKLGNEWPILSRIVAVPLDGTAKCTIGLPRTRDSKPPFGIHSRLSVGGGDNFPAFSWGPAGLGDYASP
jgi:hypothetical protein